MLPSPRQRPAPVRLLIASVASLSLTAPLAAELPSPRLHSLLPAGAKAGSTTQVRLTGAELQQATTLRFSHPGITGTRVAGSSDAENLFDVHVAENVPAGLYDVSAWGNLGLSTIRTFAVGARTERTETEPNDAPPTATTVSVGSTINGRIGKQADVDCYSFRAGPGQKVLADCLATRIDSPLLPVMDILDGRGRRVAFARAGREEDALLIFEPPVEADYTLRIYDQTYRGGDDFVYRLELHADPHLVAVQPTSGKAGQTHRAQILGFNLPAAKPTDHHWGRWPLQQAEASIDFPSEQGNYDRVLPVTPREAGVDSFSWRWATETSASQPVRMLIAGTALLLEVEPNQRREQAQLLTLPADVSGSFETVADVDLFRVDVKKGDAIWIEVFADRFGSKADAALRVEFLAEGEAEPAKVAAVDDTAGDLLPVGFETHSDDPSFRFEPPADGTCLIQLRDQYGQTRGDPSLVYRLVVRRPLPDFRLVAVPTSAGIGKLSPVSLRRGDALEFTVVAFRQDGFNGPIEIPAADLEGGLSTSGTIIPQGQSSAKLVIRSQSDADHALRPVELVGRARIPSAQGTDSSLVRPLRPAATIRGTTKVQNRDVAAVVRLARDFVIGISSETAPLEIHRGLARCSVRQGESLDIPLRLVRRSGAEGAVTVALQGLPGDAHIDAAEVTFAAGETEKNATLTIKADAPVRTYIINWIARSKVVYRRNPEEREAAQLALDRVSRRLNQAMEDAKSAESESAQAEQALANAATRTDDASLDVAALESARDAAVKRAGEAAARVTASKDEHAAAAKRLEELDRQMQELDTSAVTSPLVLEALPVAAAAVGTH